MYIISYIQIMYRFMVPVVLLLQYLEKYFNAKDSTYLVLLKVFLNCLCTMLTNLSKIHNVLTQ